MFGDSQVQFLQVGDILQLTDNDYVPADVVILQASQQNGQAFTQTDALDGERNFKSKLAMPRTQQDLKELLLGLELRVLAAKPNPDIYDFKGKILYANNGADDSRIGANVDELGGLQFIPRGSTIKFSGQVQALVVYTGRETKLMQNLGKYTFKRSQMESRIGKALIFNLICLALFIIICSIWNGIVTKEIYGKHAYVFADLGESATELSLKTAVSMYLLYNYLIPLDLAVLLEFIAIMYSGFILMDAKMAHVNRTMGRVEQAKMNSLNLLENLAEVQYLMSDKTGTLTKNELTLVAVCTKEDSYFLKGQSYSAGGKRGEEQGTMTTMGEYLSDQTDFLKCLKLCHDCTMLSISGTGPVAKKEVLTGASLDEQCLLKSVAQEKVASFKGRSAKTMLI